MKNVNGDGDPSIIDIRRDGGSEPSLIFDIRKGLNPGVGRELRMPTMLLYDEAGLKLFEDITYLEEYYLTNAEIEVLKNHAADIASHVRAGSQVVELGSGNLRKVKLLLDAFENAGKDISYYALDLCHSELERTLPAIEGKYKHVRCRGLLGTYEDGLDWLKDPSNAEIPKAILWMGSSIGNLNRKAAADFLRNIGSALGQNDLMLIGADACQDRDKVYHAYNDKEGKTRAFYLNGLKHANKVLGKEAFREADWDVIGEMDEQAGRHQAFYYPTRDLNIEGATIPKGTKIKFEESYKFSPKQANTLWQTAGLLPKAKYGNSQDDFHIHLVTPPKVSFRLKVEEYASTTVPSLQDFEQLWQAWDVVTRQMVPEDDLLSKPINLRNCCVFYLGHIPAFLDIHLTRASREKATNPAYFHQIFERGIDPDVENPEHCHAHSEIPDEWPPLTDILDYQELVRDRTRVIYASQKDQGDYRIKRALWIGFEHEVMHLETFLYMLLQSDTTMAPPGQIPNFARLAEKSRNNASPNEWIEVPASRIKIGINDPDNDYGPNRFYGWDNEKPARQAEVASFKAKQRPITNEEYAQFLQETDRQEIPASWAFGNAQPKQVDLKNGLLNGHTNGHCAPEGSHFLKEKYVRTMYGHVPLELALDWPVAASYNELAACAAWMGGRIPTADEARSIYQYMDFRKSASTDSILTKKISAVNGHLSNNGVEISPPASHAQNGWKTGGDHFANAQDLFSDLSGCNVGFQHFHPTPVIQDGKSLAGRGDMGGVWEWTSSALTKHEGFEPMSLYPRYTDDFFDDKHNIVLGGSWATHPRIAGRKSFVNWYQRSYPYAWCGARLVQDL